MIGSVSWIDILFIATVILLVLNGFSNGAIASLVNLLSIPIAFAVAYLLVRSSRPCSPPTTCRQRL